jgi:hypothetical protein
MGTSCASSTGKRTEHQRFLPGNRDKQKRVLLLAKEIEKGGLQGAYTNE